MRLLHLLTVGCRLATALLLGRIARRVRASRRRCPRFGSGAALLYIVFTTTLLDFDALAANCELYMLLPLTASVLRLPRGAVARPGPAELARRRARWSASRLLYKYQAAVQLPLYACHLASCIAVGRSRLLRAGRPSASASRSPLGAWRSGP